MWKCNIKRQAILESASFDDKIANSTRHQSIFRGITVYTFRKILLAMIFLAPLAALSAPTVKVDVIKQPYGGSRNVDELSINPDYIHAAGLERFIEERGGELIRPVQDIRLDPEQEKQYGTWNRMALANDNMADTVRQGLQDNLLTIGLEANCNVLLGMLAGLK
jgi:hypothetical protein